MKSRRSSKTRTRVTTLNDLTADPLNANRGTDRGRAALADSLKTYGPGRSILVDRKGTIIAGNKTAEQAKALGMKLRVVDVAGDELVAVRRTDLDLNDQRARALAIADNRIAELDLQWDDEVLACLKADGVDLSVLWTDDEFAALVPGAHASAPENSVVEPGATSITSGDLFQLGAHRVLCGDATSPVDVTRLLAGASPLLMATDPPYGVNYQPSWRHRANPSQRTAVGTVSNDTQADWGHAIGLFAGNVVYMWHGALHAGTVASALARHGWTIRAQIIWVKPHFAMGRGDYHWQHEPCWYAVRRGRRADWQGGRTQSTVWEAPNLNPFGGSRTGENAVTGHGTQKPVELFERAIRNHTRRGEPVYDPFVGSGTTVIAAEKSGRVAYAMDVDPRYVQVTIDRWQAFTGQRATHVLPQRRSS